VGSRRFRTVCTWTSNRRILSLGQLHLLYENPDERAMGEISILNILDPSSQGTSTFEGEQQFLDMVHSPSSIMLQPLFNNKSCNQAKHSAHYLDSNQSSAHNLPSLSAEQAHCPDTGTPQVSQRHSRPPSSTCTLPTTMVPNELAPIIDLLNASYQQGMYDQQLVESERRYWLVGATLL
jgi:hypothetical protein